MSASSRSRNRGSWLYVTILGGAIAILAVTIFGIFFVRPIAYTGQVVAYPWLPFGLFWIWPLFGSFIIIFFVGKGFFWGWRRDHWQYQSDVDRILTQRYARGEITKAQFEQLKRDLEQW